MDVQLQSALVEFLNLTTTTLTETKDFAVAQIPDVIQQLLMWKLTISLITFIVCLILGYLLVRSLLWYRRPELNEEGRCKETIFYDKFGNVAPSVVVAAPIQLLLGVVITFTITDTGFDWLQILIAPKVYVLEYISKIVL